MNPLFSTLLGPLMVAVALACGAGTLTPTSRAPAIVDRSWEKQRLDAVVHLYAITPEGQDVIESLDVRQMWGQPLYFRSSGYQGWASIGQAKPAGLVHELSHSFYGAFPVRGFPELSWEVPSGQDVSPAMDRYHQDILTFLAQPPDHYEVLRARFRSSPEISQEDPGVVFHLMEAGLVSSVAGDLGLAPPIFRKYWDRFISSGQFADWYQAVAWYRALEADDRALADQYLGFNHLVLESYKDLDRPEQAELASPVRDIILREERQRLRDFALQFESFRIAPQKEEDFEGWRSYLRDMVELHGSHPAIVPSLGHPAARELEATLDFLKGLESRTPGPRAYLAAQGMDELPLLEYLLPALDNRTLVVIFATGTDPPGRKALKGTVAFMQLLESFAPQVNSIVILGQRRPSKAADELSAILGTIDWDRERDVGLLLDLLRDSNPETARRVVSALDDDLLRRLLEVTPVQLRFILKPPRFLEMLGITEGAGTEEVIQGINAMMRHTSRASWLDAPFVEELYKMMATRGDRRRREAFEIIAGSLFPFERFVQLHPKEAVRILGSDLDRAAGFVKDSDPVRQPPARLVYRLIAADPELAAALVERLAEGDTGAIALESLAHFAYDAARLVILPQLPISLEKDGRFLHKVLEDKGEVWLENWTSKVVNVYGERIRQEEVAGDFLLSYQETLRQAVGTLPDGEGKDILKRMVERVVSSIR